MKIKHILPTGEMIFFELTDGKKAEIYCFEITLRESMRILKEPQKVPCLLKIKVVYSLFKNGTLFTTQSDFISLQKFYEKPYSTSDKKKNSSYLKEIMLSSNNQILETIVKF